MCYEVLLWRLTKDTKVTPYACADDIALTTPSFLDLWEAMRVVDRFSAASGLGVNRDKTSSFSSYLPSSPWPLTKVVKQTVFT